MDDRAAASRRLSRRNTSTGSDTAPSNAPTHQYTYQLQIGNPSHAALPRMPSTSFPIRTAIMPPLQNPINVVKQPTPTMRARERSASGKEVEGPVACGLSPPA